MPVLPLQAEAIFRHHGYRDQEEHAEEAAESPAEKGEAREAQRA